MKKTRFTNN